MSGFRSKYKVENETPKIKKSEINKMPTLYKAYDQEGNFKGHINHAFEKIQQYYLKGISIFIVNEKGELLFEKRPNKGITPGKIDLCSGHVDNEEECIEAALREPREELGIKEEETKKNIHSLGEDGCLDLNFDGRKFFIQFYVMQRETSKVITQIKEVEDVFYLPLEDGFDLIREGKTKFPYDERFEGLFKKVKNYIQEKKMEER